MPHLLVSIHHIVRKKELHKRNIQTNKRNFHHMFRITKLVSLARHAHDDHHFVQMGLFGKGEYPRHLGVPTPPKQEAASDTSMKRSSPNHTGEKCSLPLLRQRRGRSMHERMWPHLSGATLSLPLGNGRIFTASAQVLHTLSRLRPLAPALLLGHPVHPLPSTQV